MTGISKSLHFRLEETAVAETMLPASSEERTVKLMMTMMGNDRMYSCSW